MKENLVKKIIKDKDFIVSTKYNNSLQELLKENPDGVSDKVICRVLHISQKRLECLYDRAIASIRKIISDIEKL
jgi:hypothetical protein